MAIDFFHLLAESWGEAIVVLGLLTIIVVLSELRGVKPVEITHWIRKEFYHREDWYRAYQQYLDWYTTLVNAPPEKIVSKMQFHLVTWLATEYPDVDTRSPGQRRFEGLALPYVELVRQPMLKSFLLNPVGWLAPYFEPLKPYFEADDRELHQIGIAALAPAFMELTEVIHKETGLLFHPQEWLELESLAEDMLTKRRRRKIRNSVIALTTISVIAVVLVIGQLVMPLQTGEVVVYFLISGVLVFILLGVVMTYMLEHLLWRRISGFLKLLVQSFSN